MKHEINAYINKLIQQRKLKMKELIHKMSKNSSLFRFLSKHIMNIDEHDYISKNMLEYRFKASSHSTNDNNNSV